jgi:hypothetical protein
MSGLVRGATSISQTLPLCSFDYYVYRSGGPHLEVDITAGSGSQ